MLCVCVCVKPKKAFFVIKDNNGKMGIRSVKNIFCCDKGHYWDNVVCGLDSGTNSAHADLTMTLSCGHVSGSAQGMGADRLRGPWAE